MSQTEIILDAVPRSHTGTGAARAIRRTGQVPAVLYGGSDAPETISIPYSQIMRALNRTSLVSQLVTLKHADKKQVAIASDIQFHPVTDDPIHMDLIRVAKGQKARLEIPVQFIGHDNAPGLKRGGSLNIVRRSVEVMVPIDAVPSELICDLVGMDIGDNVKISSVTLPEGVVPTIQDRDFTIATLVGRVAEDVIATEDDSDQTGEDADQAEDEQTDE